VFSKLFGKRKSDREQQQAVQVLHRLDVAIRHVHPDRFIDPSEAALEAQPILVNINALLGRPKTERFFPIEYEALLDRIDYCAERQLLEPLLAASRMEPVFDALIRGVSHEWQLRLNKHRHDNVNLGREIKASTLTLIDFLNRHSRARPEPMPDSI